MPSTSVSSVDDPDAQARDALVERRATDGGAGRRSTSSRSGSWPPIDVEQQRGVGDGRRERPDLVERRRERDRARSATPRRTSASPRRRRTARRAGGSSRRCRSRARAARTRPRPRRPIRRSSRRARASRSCGLRVGPNAEFSVDEPIANSSRLVLPTITAPASRNRARPRSRRTAAASPRGSATSTSWGCRACRGCP